MLTTREADMARPLSVFLLNLLMTLVCCLLIFIQSALPSPESIPDIPHLDKVAHFGVYGILAVLFFRTFESPLARISPKTAMVLGVLASALYGMSDELHQYYVPYRDADLLDLAADVLGSAFGVFAYRYLTKHHSYGRKPG